MYGHPNQLDKCHFIKYVNERKKGTIHQQRAITPQQWSAIFFMGVNSCILRSFDVVSALECAIGVHKATALSN